MRKALVLGASGGMGYALVKELAEQGVQTVALARTEEKLNRLFKEMENVRIAVGNVNKIEDIIDAGKDVDVIFHAVNIPYPEWATGQSIIMENILAAAKALKAKLAIVDNIYAYGRGDGRKIDESYPKRPHTKKGNIRLEMEHMVNQARERGVQSLIAHFPDFYGPHASNTVLHHTLETILSGKRAIFVGRQDVERSIFSRRMAQRLLSH